MIHIFSRDNQWRFWTFSLIRLGKKFSEKRKPFLKKNYQCFLVESTSIENVTLPNKITLPKANVRQNKTWSTKWPYHKERILNKSIYSFLQRLILIIKDSHK